MRIPPIIELSEPCALDDAAPIRKLVRFVLYKAVAEGASEVHFRHSDAENFSITFKIGEGMESELPPPIHVAQTIVNVVKVMANLDFAVRDRPRQGQVFFEVFGELGAANVEIGQGPFSETASVYFAAHPASQLPPEVFHRMRK